MSSPAKSAPPSPPGLEALIAVGVSAASPQLVTEAIRMAYALGVFDGALNLAKTQIATRAADAACGAGLTQ